MARPSDYTLELVAAICERIASGEPLTKICAADDMPGMSTVYRWLVSHSEFREIYARAREDQADTLADEVLKIADEEGKDPQTQRLRVDARKWVAAKLKPKKYGEKTEVAVEHSGAIEHRGLPEVSSRIADLLASRPDGDRPASLPH